MPFTSQHFQPAFFSSNDHSVADVEQRPANASPGTIVGWSSVFLATWPASVSSSAPFDAFLPLQLQLTLRLRGSLIATAISLGSFIDARAVIRRRHYDRFVFENRFRTRVRQDRSFRLQTTPRVHRDWCFKSKEEIYLLEARKSYPHFYRNDFQRSRERSISLPSRS